VTLIAGIKCLDGYIVAADTAITTESNVRQGRKVVHYKGTDGAPFRIICAGCGNMAYARMASEKIRDAVEQLTNRTLLAMKRQVEEVLRAIYISHIGAVHWQHGHEAGEPQFSLVVALEAADGHGIYRTDQTAVCEIDPCSFGGTGEELANFLAERLLVEKRTMTVQLSTAAAVQLTKHIFKASKKSSAGVGGNTEILARLTDTDGATPFSDPLYVLPMQESLERHYLWGIDEQITHGLRTALRAHSSETELTRVTNRIAALLKDILHSANKERSAVGTTGRCMHLVEMDDATWSANYSDHPSET
jgi:20S proteasome alpha/beta subunit